MHVKYEQPPERPGSLVVHLDGSLNALTADQLWESVSLKIDDGESVVVFDFARVTMLTSAGIGILVRLYTRLKDREGSLAIFGCSSKIREIFTIVMLDEVLKVCNSEDEAWQALQP